jgi:hypothetical protein
LIERDMDGAEESARHHTDRFKARVMDFLGTNLAERMKF